MEELKAAQGDDEDEDDDDDDHEGIVDHDEVDRASMHRSEHSYELYVEGGGHHSEDNKERLSVFSEENEDDLRAAEYAMRTNSRLKQSRVSPSPPRKNCGGFAKWGKNWF